MIRIDNCTKVYVSRDGTSRVKALDCVDLTVKDKEFVALLGPSGCGKTTLLKIVAGLIPWDDGIVFINDEPVNGPGPDRAVVFQNFALMPWADIKTNVAFGLELQGVDKEEREATAARLIETVGLKGFEDRYPRHLSGGMQQRVGLARALAVNPDTLLMDEPFGALDSQTRRFMQEDLLHLHEKEPKTVMFVTHSMEEGLRLADRIILMSSRPGKVKEIIDVPFGHPRPDDINKDPEFGRLNEYLWEQLKSQQVRPEVQN
jgi:ABC-type nitrate/sulfonate/bicarbonate transport system ATPase subunit